MNHFKETIHALEKEFIDWRRFFHGIPEIAMEERKTAAGIVEKLSSWGLEVRAGIGGTGVLGILRGAKEGRTLGIRADIDALPVTEETGLQFASSHTGRMHACGHDGHIAIALGAAKVLSGLREELKGTVVFIFQPGEEVLNGAQKMIDDGALDDPKPDAVVGLHIWPDLPLGSVAVRGGAVMAAVDRFNAVLIGRGGHGAIPQKSVDPVVMASEVVLSLQRIVSREIDPLKAGVLTVGRIQGGTAFNVIPERVELEGTVRTFDTEIRELIPKRMEEIIAGIASGSRGSYNFDYEFGIPATVNDEALAESFRKTIEKTFGKEKTITRLPPSMGGEDFALFQEKVPGVYLFLGTACEERPPYPIHHPKYTLDERVLPVGVQVFCEIAAEFLGDGGRE